MFVIDDTGKWKESCFKEETKAEWNETREKKNNFAAQYIVGNNMQYGQNREEMEQHYFYMFIINFHYNFINQVQRFVVHLS